MKTKVRPPDGVCKFEAGRPQPTKHEHRCPLCRKVTIESSDSCGMPIDHVFACTLCLQEYILRLKLDVDVVLDVCLD